MGGLEYLTEEIARRLRARGETIAVAESSSGGLISAALLAEPNASAFFVGGSVLYTAQARTALLGITAQDLGDIRSSTEPYAGVLARTVRERLGTTWGLAETGAAGPSGNRYGDPAGHCCIAVAGTSEAARTLATGRSERAENMRLFASGALALLLEQLAPT